MEQFIDAWAPWIVDRFDTVVRWLVAQGIDRTLASLGLGLCLLILSVVGLVILWQLLTWPWRVARHARERRAANSQERAIIVDSSVDNADAAVELSLEPSGLVIKQSAEAPGAAMGRTADPSGALVNQPAKALNGPSNTSVEDQDLLQTALKASDEKLGALGSAGPAEDPRMVFKAALEGYLSSEDPRGRELVELLAAADMDKATQVALSIPRSVQAVLDETEGADSTVRKEQAQWWRYAAAIAAPFDSIVALTACQMARNLDPEDPEGANQLGQAYHRFGNSGEAETAYRCALRNAGGGGDGEAVALAGLGAIALKRDDLTGAEDCYRRALVLFEQLGRKRPQSGILNDLGDIANTRGDFADAQILFKRGLALAEELGLEREQSAVLNNLGNVSQAVGDLDEAEGYYRRSLAIDERLGMRHGQASGLGNLGLIALGRGDLDEAEELLEQAVAINEELGSKNQVANLFNLGEIAKMRGDLDKAEGYFERCLALSEQSSDTGQQGDVLVALGTIAYQRRELDTAERRFRHALSIAEQLESKAGQAVALHNLADVAAARGKFDEAEEQFKRTLALNEELGRKRGQANNLSKLGQLARVRGYVDAADDYHKRAIALHEQIGSKTGLAAEHFNLGLVAEMRGDRAQQCLLWVESRNFYEQASIQHEVEDVERRMRAAGCYGAVPTLPVAAPGFVGTNGLQWWAQDDEHAFQMGEVDGMSGNPFNPPVQTGDRYRKAYEGGFELGREDLD